MADAVFEVETKSVALAVKELQRLERSFQSLANTAGGKVTKEMMKTERAIRSQERALDLLRKQYVKSEMGVDRFGGALSVASKKMSRGSVVTQQFGYQLGDFIVQVQSGQSAFIAFSQQATQLAGLLPPVAGLIAALAFSLGGMVGQLLWSTRRTEEAVASFKNLRQASKALREEIDKLALSNVAEALGLSEDIVKSSNFLKTMKGELSELNSEIADLETQRGPNTTRQLRNLREQRDALQEQVTTLEGLIERAKELYKEIEPLSARFLEAAREALKLKFITDNITFRSALANIGLLIGDLRTAAELSARIQSGIASNLYNGSPLASALLPTSEELEVGLNANDRAGAGRAGQRPGARSLSLANDLLFGDAVNSGGGGGGGSSGPSPLEQLREELRLREYLVNKTEEQRSVIESLGLDFSQANTETVNGLADQMKAIDEATKRVDDYRQSMEDLKNGIAESFTDGFMAMIDGTQSVEEAFKSMARNIVKELLNILIVQNMLSSFSGGTSMRNPANMFRDAFGFAKGGVVERFASGGVVNGPVNFMHTGGAGRMGEAGPEAILPLSRGPDGKLGVASQGGGSNVTQHFHFNISANGDESVKRIVMEQAPAVAAMAQRGVIDGVRRGGSMKKAFK